MYVDFLSVGTGSS